MAVTKRLLALQESKYNGMKEKFMGHIVPTPMKHYNIKYNLSPVYKCPCAIIQQCGKVKRECGDMFSGVPIVKSNFMETIVFRVKSATLGTFVFGQVVLYLAIQKQHHPKHILYQIQHP